jgi:uncharacterized Zn finger protein
MSGELLNDGQPIVVTTPRDRIGHGPWARLFATAVVGSEGSSVAERGRALARAGAVHSVRLERGTLSARVVGDDGRENDVSLRADPVPPRIWSVVAKSARGKERFEAAVAGREQSVHLEHLLAFEWSEPLVPRAIARTCTCADERACEHVAGLAYVIADLIDNDPSLLLRWRGCVEGSAEPEEAASEEEPEPVIVLNEDDWQPGPFPARRTLRPLPVGAVLTCFGESGLPVGGVDLRDALQRAYASFSRR